MTSITYEEALPTFADAVYKFKYLNAFQASAIMEALFDVDKEMTIKEIIYYKIERNETRKVESF